MEYWYKRDKVESKFVGITYFLQICDHGEVTSLSSWHHVRTKFTTPILHAIYNFKIYDILATYT